MGEVVGAALLAHVPTIVLPEKDRRELNNGVDSTLVAGLEELPELAPFLPDQIDDPEDAGDEPTSP